MSEPEINGKIYFGATCGTYEAYQDKTDTYAGVTLGAELKQNNTIFKADITEGNASGMSINLTQKFPTHKNLGFELTGYIEHLQNHKISTKLSETTDKSPVKWHNGYTKYGAKGLFGFDNDKFKIQGGIESGWRKSFAPTDYKHDSGLYITPAISVEANITDGISLKADADLKQASMGIIISI